MRMSKSQKFTGQILREKFLYKNLNFFVDKLQSFLYNKENMKKVWSCGYISKVRKMQICLFASSFPAYVVFYRIYKKKHPVT